MLTPFDDRMTQSILIPLGQEIVAVQAPEPTKTTPKKGKAGYPHRVLGTEAETVAASHDDLEGLVVDVEITSWPTPTKPPIGRVTEVLGHPDDFGVDVEMIIRKHQ